MAIVKKLINHSGRFKGTVVFNRQQQSLVRIEDVSVYITTCDNPSEFILDTLNYYYLV